MEQINKRSKELTKKFNKEMETIFHNPKTFQHWIKTSLNFRHYSLYNRCLITLQDPDATYVATYKQWQDKGFRVIKKGGIHLARPNFIKGFYRDKKFIPLSKATDEEKNDISSGKIKSCQIMKGFSYFTVFDISKTNATEDDLAKLTSQKIQPKNSSLETLLYAYDRQKNPKQNTKEQIRDILNCRIAEIIAESNCEYELSPSQINLINDGVLYGYLSIFNEDTTDIKMLGQKDFDDDISNSKQFSRLLSSVLETVLDDIIPYC